VRAVLAIGAVALAAALATPLALAAARATPDEAFAQLSSCLRQGGALKIVKQSNGGGTAFFRRPFVRKTDATGAWLSWEFDVSGGQVTGASIGYNVHAIPRPKRRAANACLKPFHTHMWN
jgi:putative hemolysin